LAAAIHPLNVRNGKRIVNAVRNCGPGRARGIFRANFGSNVTGLELCHQRMWCRRCYTSKNGPSFQVSDEENLYVAEQGDENCLSAGWKPKPEDLKKHSEARDGDDLIVSFECDFCSFAKVTGRLLYWDASADVHLMGCI
jgi:hypothetical protein